MICSSLTKTWNVFQAYSISVYHLANHLLFDDTLFEADMLKLQNIITALNHMFIAAEFGKCLIVWRVVNRSADDHESTTDTRLNCKGITKMCAVANLALWRHMDTKYGQADSDIQCLWLCLQSYCKIAPIFELKKMNICTILNIVPFWGTGININYDFKRIS